MSSSRELPLPALHINTYRKGHGNEAGVLLRLIPRFSHGRAQERGWDFTKSLFTYFSYTYLYEHVKTVVLQFKVFVNVG